MENVIFTQLSIAEVRQLFRQELQTYFEANQLQPAQAETDRWFDLTELCNYLPDKPVKPTVYGWVHQRAIPNHRRGKKLYFLKSEIDIWLKEGRKKTFTEIQAEAQKPTGRKKV